MEWKIGEIRQINGEWYQCINPKIYGCSYCDLQNKCIDDIKGKVAACHARYRSDKKCVVFKKLEKLGEPYFNGQYGKVLQEYKYYIPPITPDLRIHIIKLGIVGIEIKQNKEDMEEKKQKIDKLVDDYMACRIQYSEFDKEIKALYDKEESEPTLKEFDLEAAKAGKPVCTRDGRNARIICFDAKGDYPIIALIDDTTKETNLHYNVNGRAHAYTESDYDLMMLPEKREGWVNIDWDCNAKRVTIESEEIYDTKEDALRNVSSQTHKDTVKIEWEE